jgi:LPS-assembly protein
MSPRPIRNLLALGIFASLFASSAGAAEKAPCKPGDFACTPPSATPAGMCGAYPLLAERETLAPASGDESAAQADSVSSTDGVTFDFNGHVRLLRGDELLRAGHVAWDNDSTAWRADGGVLYQGPSMLMRAAAMHGTDTPRLGTAESAEFQLLDSRGNGSAREARMLPDNQAALDGITYSTCSPDARGWELRAKHVDIDQNANIGRAHDVSMRLGSVPILWLPYLRFPTNEDRHTGLLYPTLGYSSNRGFDITLPWYLNLAPNYDATLYPRLLTRRGAMLGVEFRYLTDNSRGEFRADYLPHDREADQSRGLIYARSQTRLSPDWRFNVNLNHVSDRRYFEDLGDGLYRAATQLLSSSVYLRGNGEWWSAAVGADSYQITDPDLPQSFEPYRRVPRVLFDAELPLAGGLSAGMDDEFVGFHKDKGLDGQRLDLYPYLEWALQGPYWHLTPRLGYRYTAYHLDRDEDSSPNRGTPIASVDAGLTFERDLHLFGQDWTQTLEPRAYYLRVPYRNQDDIPIFDTSEQAFDFWQLFSDNRFSGADRQMDANDLTVALTTRLLDGDGVERFSASLGQIHYFDPQRVQMPGHAPTDFTGSAWVGQVSASLNERWRVSLAQQWNPNRDDHHTDLSTVSLQRLLHDDGVLNLSYRYRRGYLEQIDASALYPLNPRWSLVGRWNYAFDQDKTLEALAGFEYDSCCVAVRLLGRHFVRNSAGDTDNGVMLEIEFKGLGAFGQRAEDFLSHAILGYQ